MARRTLFQFERRRLERGAALREAHLRRGARSLLGRRPRPSARSSVSLSAIQRALQPRARSSEAAFSRRARTRARSSRCTRGPHPEVLGAQGEATAPCASTGVTTLLAKRDLEPRRERARWMRGRCAMRGAFPRGLSKECERALGPRSETRRTQFPALRIALQARAGSRRRLLAAWSAAFTGKTATVCVYAILRLALALGQTEKGAFT
jgi:hypothetical protein